MMTAIFSIQMAWIGRVDFENALWVRSVTVRHESAAFIGLFSEAIGHSYSVALDTRWNDLNY